MRQAGRYLPEYRKLRQKAGGFLDLVYRPELAVEITLQPLRRFKMSAAILFSDILVIPHALGQALEFVPGRGPVLDPISDLAGIDALQEDGFLERLKPVFETVSGVASALDEKTALIGFCGASWTVASYMIEGGGSKDHKRLLAFASERPGDMERLQDILVRTSIDYLCAQCAAGAEALQIFDTWAGRLSGDREGLQRWVFEPTRRMVEGVRKRYPHVPLIGFPKGIGAGVADYVEATGVDAISLDGALSAGQVDALLPSDFPLQGMLEPSLLLEGGDVMLEAAEDCLEAFRGRPHIFNLGHGITPEVAPENVAQLSAFLGTWTSG